LWPVIDTNGFISCKGGHKATKVALMLTADYGFVAQIRDLAHL